MPLTVHGIPEILALNGRDLGHSDWKEITQELIDAYAAVSGDHQWIHTDVERAAAGPYGRTIAHGYMVLSWGIPMFGELLQVRGVGRALNYGVNRVRYPAPVPVGSRVRLHASVTGVTGVAHGGVRMDRSFTFELEGSPKPACVAESLTHFYP
ncbi:MULTISPECIES: MaoC family dehydratase [unclassified Streptomyces]|uniref:MaoC family dehydratase n=1 Tax=unclassified Streptomyces TaxID=2593676 RepID=UPI00224EFA2E|nr:MaoC family dehydratase [Streptomyces sp. NBC_00338]MCX5143713.1 MaoC family dehydratase [Streptomyces sp. NBC_00338]WSU62086.1 MaoC family dehydratase [Streptomyces sp. NBC_01104]